MSILEPSELLVDDLDQTQLKHLQQKSLFSSFDGWKICSFICYSSHTDTSLCSSKLYCLAGST